MARKLVFAVNGERFELAEVDPSTTLLEFLRTQTRFRGPKLGCGEGGCGACVVLLSTYHPVSEQVKEFSISSCLTLLCSINFCSVTTSEGLGNSEDGFHPIHQRFAGFHASQCGFCTPGMCMSLFSALTNADKTSRPEPPGGFSKITKTEAEKAIAGNLCRCTGYRPIVDVCKSFAADVDLEDLGLNTFWKKGNKDATVCRLPCHSHKRICTFPEFLKSEIKSSMDILDNFKNTGLPECQWYRPTSIEELYELLNSDAFLESHVKLVVGNTGSGVYKENDVYDKYIDLKGIPELSVIRRDSGGVSFGAAVTISMAIEVLKQKNESELHSDERLVFSKIADHMDKVATPFIRNMASLGGNLIMAQRSQFASDVATILLAAGSTICLQTASERLVLPLEEFLQRPPCDDRTVLISIHVPFSTSVMESSSGANGCIDSEPTKEADILFETYRAAPRPLGNAIAYVNSAFLAHVTSYNISGDLVIHNIHLAFGAYGSEHAVRARKVENFLVGKPVTACVLLGAIKLLKETIIPNEHTPHSRYRSSLAIAFLFKFFQPLLKDLSVPEKNVQMSVSSAAATIENSNGCISGFADDLPHKALNVKQLDQVNNPDLILSSEQTVEFCKDYHPVGDPIKKTGVELQASGEAIYVDDIPSPKNCLYGAFVNSTRPLAHIKGIKFKSTSSPQKAFTFIGADDIPKGGQNVGLSWIFGTESLFAHSLTECAGQPLGIVIAETQRQASMAAKQADVQYCTDNLEPPILSVEDAVRRSSFFKVPPFLCPQKVGDLSKGMAEADHKILSAEVKLGSQYYFYMETQTALAIPDEDNCILVYSSTQCPEMAQDTIAKCLGIPAHNVRVITRRVGGGFGGKGPRSVPVATACALAAFRLRRPVRMYLDRKTDMIMTGGRHPMHINYSVGFKSDGKITALHVDILVNAGITVDVSVIMPQNMVSALKKYNWGALSFDIRLCKTNFSTKSAMRGPGEVQGSFIAESVIEHVASFLSMDANSVRKKNLHTYDSLMLFYEGSAGDAPEYTLPAMIDGLASSASYFDRLEIIRHFNSCNKWRKRGISLVPVVYQVTLRPTPGKVSILTDGSIVVEVGGIEIGQGLWTKVKQMTAFALGQLWGDGSQNLLDRVRIIQADTLSLVQGGFTAGSTTSEASCEAVRLSCNVLVDRLKSLKQSLEDKIGSISWDTLIFQANMQSVNLSERTYWVPEDASISYLNFGAAISEVEVDVLTGATIILRTDLTYDCGQSLNPAVDLGQIEGAFVQGIGFFMCEEYLENSDGLVISDGTWTYKIPTIDTIPRQFNVKLWNSGHHEKRVLSSKASGEPPLVLACSIHSATREAIIAARMEFSSATGPDSSSSFQLEVPATMPVVKELCGLDNVEKYLENLVSSHKESNSEVYFRQGRRIPVGLVWLLDASFAPPLPPFRASDLEIRNDYMKYKDPKQPINVRIKDLMDRMTLAEKIGQMTQIEREVASAQVMKNYFIGSVLSGGGSVPRPQASAADWVNMRIGAATALEVRATGIPYVFAPCIAVCRDPRWGRCYESYSEDHNIVQQMTEIIPGLQGDVPAKYRKGVPYVSGKEKVAACAKHYVGDGGTHNGINENNTILNRAGLLSIHMPAYLNSIIKGVSTIMVSYSSWNGVKMHANRDLVTGYLKNTLRFRGFVISDWQGIDRITSSPGANYTYSVQAGISAGIDMVMVPYNYSEFINDLTSLVKKNVIPLSRIDDAVGRILRVKFTIGLFENPLADLSLVDQLGKKEHRDLAREAVRKSLVLLKNGKSTNDSFLPLPRKAAKILIAGSHANNLGYQCGGWTIEWQGDSGNITVGTTILDAVRSSIDPSTEVVYSENPDSNIVKGNDFSYAIVVVGEPPYTETAGDNLNLELPDPGPSIIQTVCGTIKCVVIIISGRPVVIEPYVPLVDALVAAWLPGSEGQGLTDVLFGDYGFTGKLSRTWFKSVDQLPMNVGDKHYDPLFPFGFGLTTKPTSGRSFSSNLRIVKHMKGSN
ncbi:aldehyde oxidase [Musa troglodytarum]|uniref:Aldehyde oxidase n=1 Tax=Musa troglodytarum TaxID=320322 RepID=A0A9E7KU05_9LILI|nr:aldehyde oxidase [Musa troglodytarum]